jgi:hypothetical protein
VLHCGNTDCTSGNTIKSPDTGGDVGQYSSLVLDSNGYPAISYYDATNGNLKVMRCNDANCDSSVNGAEYVNSPDQTGDVGRYTSLALDSSFDQKPVVSYYDASNKDLKVLHCGDFTCTSGNTKYSPDQTGDVGQYTSLALAVWYEDEIPVVSYYDVTNGDLKVLRCGDANCSSGNTITSPDTTGNVGAYTSLAWGGGEGYYPVISYYDVTNGDLKVLYCGDNHCGSENSINSPDTTGNVGAYTSLAWGGGEGYYPVISYYDLDNGDLKVMHCNDAACDPDLPQGEGTETITSPDTAGDVGQYTSLDVFSGDGTEPVVTYYDADHGTLKVLHCGSTDCTADNSITTADPGGYVGQYTSLRLDGSGRPVISYYDAINKDLKVLHCGDANCTSGNSIASPDTAGAVGLWTSLALDSSGYPVVSYYEGVSQLLKVMHCNDPNCAGGNESISPIEGVGETGSHSSLALDASGKPVVSYLESHLKVVHCNDVNCAGGNESITDPDMGDVGEYTSLALDSSGYPVISYYDYFPSHKDLKVLHCNDPNCAPGGDGTPIPDDIINSPDTGGDVGQFTSLALDSNGHPVVSYYDATNGDLKVMHCNDANCDPTVPPPPGGAESIASPDTTGDVGQYTSLVLDAQGKPVVSYYDATKGDLKVLHCDDVDCSGDESLNITFPDTVGNVGQHTSLRLDAQGKPVVSYLDYTNGDLKVLVLRCDNLSCATLAYPTAGTDVLPVSLHFDHVYLCAEGGTPTPGCLDVGAATFSGTGEFARGIPYKSGTYNTIDTEVLSMVLTGTVHGDDVTIKAGTQEGLTEESTGKIREQTPDTFYPADTWFDLFFKVESSDSNYDDTQNCDFGAGAQAVRFTGVTTSIPAMYVEYRVPSCPLEPPPAGCVAGCGEAGIMAASGDYDVERYYTTGGGGTGIWMSVGGIAEWPGTAAGPDSLAGPLAGSGFNYTALGGALATVAVLAAGAWFARRRRAR